MSEKLSKIRLIKINGEVLIGRRDSSIPDLKAWYERNGDAINETHILALTDRSGDGKLSDPIYASLVEAKEYEPEDLPMFL